MLNYKVWTSEEYENKNLCGEGIYKFTIDSIITKPSKAGNEMLVIDFSFLDTNNMYRTVKDFIVLTSAFSWKLRDLAQACGLLDLYEEEKLDIPDLINKKGFFEIGIKDYEDKKLNHVKAYLKPDEKYQTNNKMIEEINKDIPF